MAIHIFNLKTDICESCGISHKEMIDIQAMNDCPGKEMCIAPLPLAKIVRIKGTTNYDGVYKLNNDPVYIKARLEARTMEVEVSDRGIWISLDTYRRQRRLNEEEFMPKAREIVSGMPWKSGVEMPKDSTKFFERIGDLGASKKSEEKPEPKEPLKNYCAPRKMFSQCRAGKTWKAHEKCRFSAKATRAERCMYFRNLNGTKHCDSVDAQKAPYLSMEDS